MTKVYDLESDVYFGSVKASLPDWRHVAGVVDEEDPDDELLEKTPPSVLAVLGFDPIEFDEEKSVGRGQKHLPGRHDQSSHVRGGFVTATDRKAEAKMRAMSGEELHNNVDEWGDPPHWSERTYGAVLINEEGKILLREPMGHYGGYHWTFPKGCMDSKSEHPIDVAKREALEETGHDAVMTKGIPKVFERGDDWRNYYFVAKSAGEFPDKMDNETKTTKWATLDEAEEMLGRTSDPEGRQRDLDVLNEMRGILRKNIVGETKHLPGRHDQSSHGRGAGSLSGTLSTVMQGTGYSKEQIQDALSGDCSGKNPQRAKKRAKIIGAIYASGTSVPNAINKVLDNNGSQTKERLKAIVKATKGNNPYSASSKPSQAILSKANKELGNLPRFDLDVVGEYKVKEGTFPPDGVCQLASRDIIVGTGSMTGTWRHELGHAIRASWGGDKPSAKRVITKAVSGEYDKVKGKIKKNLAGIKTKMSHEWYEKEYGVAGRRSVDNWEENAAEHYRLYHREVYRDRNEGGGGKQLAQYRERHPTWSKIWDAHYTAALLGQELQGGRL